jgi:hypothetical protein
MDECDSEARPPAPDDDRTGNDLPARAPHIPTALPAAESEEPVGPPVLPHATARRRVLRALGIGATVLLVLALAFPVLSNASVAIDLRTLLQGPTPTPTPILSPTDSVFSWVDGVPWGALQVDGRPGPDLHQPSGQTAQGFSVLPSFTLPRGRHMLRYMAALFPPLTCTVSVPAAPTDTCPLSRDAVSTDPALLGRSWRVLDLQATIERLPAEQRTALQQAIQALLTASEALATVAPGTRYLGVDGQVQVATQSLQASPQFTLNEDPRYPQAGFYNPCITLCLLPPLDQFGPRTWWLVGHVVVHWRYARADGAVELDQAPAAPMVQDEHAGVELAVQWTDHWQVDFGPGPGSGPGSDPAGNASGAPMICLVGGAMLDRLRAEVKTSLDELTYQWPFAVATPQQGCLYVGSTQVGVQGQPIGPSAFVLYQFGVLLAANQQAVHLFPQALVATPAEQALARQLAPPGTSG